MKNLFVSKFTVCALVGALGVAIIGCGDDDSSFASRPEDDSSIESSSSSAVQSSSERSGGDTLSSSGVEKSSSSGEKSAASSATSSESEKSSSSSSSEDVLPNVCNTEEGDFCEYGTWEDIRDGHVYKTVRFGKQVWMAENLEYVKDSLRWYSCPDSLPVPCDSFGYFYWRRFDNFPDCPPGMHLPTSGDVSYLIANATSAGIRSTDDWVDHYGHVKKGTNAYGFSILPEKKGNASITYWMNGIASNSTVVLVINTDAIQTSDVGNYHYLNDYHPIRCLMNEVPATIVKSVPYCKVQGDNQCQYGKLTDERDGKTYKTITIGEQTWMAENLDYEFQDTSVFNVCYDNFESSCKMYGRLYDFNAAQKACPAGWHLPDTLEWCLLKRLADNGFGMMDYLENGYGFDALKGGNYLFENKKFVDKGSFVEFWTSSASDYYSGEDVRYNMSMEYGTDGARFRLVNMSNGAYVRCVKDGSQHPLPGAEIFVDKR